MLNYFKNNIMLTFIITMLFGLVLIFQTQEFLLTINYVIVAIFSIVGVVQIISYIFSKAYKNNSYYGLIMGVTCIWIAITFYQAFLLGFCFFLQKEIGYRRNDTHAVNAAVQR